ncbi:hypothetical protein ACGFK1_01860 [Mycobacterium sp. NPDC048908]|uniref:hypothetical protein n=1 Tax=Mycobacterium sp. NPDC048908 TaxID=3364292 RepID=UPI00371A44F7
MKERPQTTPGAEWQVRIQRNDGDVLSLRGAGWAVKGQVEPVRRAEYEPPVLGPHASSKFFSHNDGRRPIRRMKNSADSVVERSLRIESCSRGIPKPLDETIQETTESRNRIPLP